MAENPMIKATLPASNPHSNKPVNTPTPNPSAAAPAPAAASAGNSHAGNSHATKSHKKTETHSASVTVLQENPEYAPHKNVAERLAEEKFKRELHEQQQREISIQFGLVGLEPIVDVVKTLLWTGQIKGERPASAIICAPIGSGKTSVLEKLQTPTSKFLSDFTARDARDIIKQKELTHVMIGDLLSVLGHKHGTVKLSLNLLAKLTGDKVMQDPWSGETIEPRRIGILTGIPPKELHSNKLRSLLWESGFASRFIIIKYEYSVETMRRIHDYIESDAYTKSAPLEIHIESAIKEVEIPADIAHKINYLAQHIKNDEIGARAHHHLRALVKARARMNQRESATNEDFMFIEQIVDFFTQRGRTI
jgi:hypothetical protein